MDYKKNIYKLYLIMFFHNLIPAYVIERLFWEQRGMTVFMVVLCEIIYAATVVILEIPTGILADKLSRKAMLLVWSALSAFEMLLLLFANGFADFAFVMLLAGISGSCASGAFNALLYDSLLVTGEHRSFEKILGRVNAFDLLAALLAALSGGVLAQRFNYEFNYILSTVSMVAALGFTMSLKEPPKGKADEKELQEAAGYKHYIKAASEFYKSHPAVVFMVISAMSIAACLNYVDEFWQLYLRDISFPVLYFGVFSAAILLIRIPGNLIAAYLIKRFRAERILVLVLMTITVGLLVAGILPGYAGILAIAVTFLASGIVDPLVSGYLHHRTSSEIRATVDSIQSLGKRAITLIAGLGFGYVSSAFSVATGFIFLGFVSLIFMLFYIRSLKLHKQIS